MNELALVKQLEAARDEAGLLDLLDRGQSLPVRRAAAKSLALIARPDTAPVLAVRLAAETDRVIRLNLIEGLGRLGEDAGLPPLLAALDDRELAVREAAVLALARFNSAAAYEGLLSVLANNDPARWQVRAGAAQALGVLGDRRAVPALIDALRDSSLFVAAAAARSLGMLGDRRAIPDLKQARHTTNHRPGAECALCDAIDNALRLIDTPQ